MIHPLLLAYARAEQAEHAAPTDAPTGVRSPAMVTHRAYAAWAEAGFPVETEFPVEATVSAHSVMKVERAFGSTQLVTTGRTIL